MLPKEDRVTTIREIRRDEVDLVTDLYLELCRSLSERDAEWGVPDREPIRRWIERTTETDDAVCLVPEIDGGIAGYLLASVSGHPAMPGVVGELEELYVRPRPSEDAIKRELVEAGVAWARARDAGVIGSKVGLDAPWTDEELGFWDSLGFEHDTTEVKRYFLDGCD
jgi:GNAT superfamily N-acetyltransferase